MKIYSRLNPIRNNNKAIIIGCVCFSVFICACALLEAAEAPNKLEAVKEQARLYHAQGLQSQRMGDMETAMAMYQKAIGLDSLYAEAYSDLGIIYEGMGLKRQAEDIYLKAIRVDPSCLSAYSNLALFYEKNRDLERAVIYWTKRAQLGSPDDPWTQRAAERLQDIYLVLSQRPLSYAREQNVLSLMQDIQASRAVIEQDYPAMANEHFSKARSYYRKGEYAPAIKEALDAQYFAPENKEIQNFIEQVQTRALSR